MINYSSTFFAYEGIQIRRDTRSVASEDGSSTTAMNLIDRFLASKPAWMHDKRRNCAGQPPQMFFGEGSQRAVVVCEGCPLQAPCLRFAMDNNEFGVWGGTTERERERLRRFGSVKKPKGVNSRGS